MAVSGSTVGVDNWPRRWKEKAAALESVDWRTFRQDVKLMEGIQTRPGGLALWIARARAFGLSLEHCRDSGVGSPQGETVEDCFVTANSVRMACYAHVILENWKVPSPFRILDIGGGYGGLLIPFWLRAVPSAYHVIDSEPCVRMQLMFAERTTKVPAAEFNGTPVDLVVNTNSLGEMDLPEVRRYFALIERWLVDGGAFYTQNRLERVTDFRRYPYGQGWRHVLVRHPFGDKAWVECLSVRDRTRNDPHPVTML